MISISIIYKLTSPSGKCYIGLTTRSLEVRVKEHLNNANDKRRMHLPIYRAINKYGIENFIIEKIFEEDIETAELQELEIKLIEQYDSFNSGYNSTMGGEATVGHKWNDKQKRMLSEIRKSQVYDKEAMSKRASGENNPMYGIRGADAPSARAVRIIELDLEFDTIRDCANYLLECNYVTTISTGNISSACRKVGSFKKGKYKGYTFEYVEN